MGKSKLDIGLRQVRVLCQMPQKKRLEVIAQGLPIILSSAQGFRQASLALKSNLREAEVLAGFAEEEAAKILILIDAVRCPTKILPSRMGPIVSWFYDHLARLIYADAVTWKPMHVAQLREYVDMSRRAHYVDGLVGEYILPNWSIYERESRLYADIEDYGDGNIRWNSPTNQVLDFFTSSDHALSVAEAMSALGMFTIEGLKATSEVWGQVAFTSMEGHSDAEHLTKELLRRLVSERLLSEDVTQADVNVLFDRWQLPMYDFDFSPIHASRVELRAEQQSILWSEINGLY
ncbi:hypothetical protein [Pelagibius sp.]|uniref:hypothetical protein n=1 Tax=Pelagibius sp. TaxID=1931238 RepID=UPI0026054D3B|nr:hypothetical protein [Pelagibius sp.]